MDQLTVLVRGEGAGVNVEVGVDLDGSDAEPARLDQRPDAAGNNALAYTANDTTTDEDELEVFGCHPERRKKKRRCTHSQSPWSTPQTRSSESAMRLPQQANALN